MYLKIRGENPQPPALDDCPVVQFDLNYFLCSLHDEEA